MICGFTHGRNWKVEEAGTGEQESPQLHGPKATVGGPPPLPPCQVLASPQDRPPAPLSNASSASLEMIMWFFTYHLLMWCMMLIDLLMLNHPCESGVNPTWSSGTIFLCCWILLAKILLRIFVSKFIKDIGL